MWMCMCMWMCMYMCMHMYMYSNKAMFGDGTIPTRSRASRGRGDSAT